MAAFALSFSASQSSDGKVVTIVDISPWGAGNNSENYTESQFVRTLVLTDAFNSAITTITLNTGINSATYNVPVKTNPWINITYNAVGPQTYTLIQKYPFQRIFELAYLQVIKTNCGCGCIGDNKLCQVDALFIGAEFAVPVGDAGNYQDNIDSAYKLLTA